MVPRWSLLTLPIVLLLAACGRPSVFTPPAVSCPAAARPAVEVLSLLGPCVAAEKGGQWGCFYDPPQYAREFLQTDPDRGLLPGFTYRLAEQGSVGMYVKHPASELAETPLERSQLHLALRAEPATMVQVELRLGAHRRFGWRSWTVAASPEWTAYELPVGAASWLGPADPGMDELVLAVSEPGTGRVWVDNARLEVVPTAGSGS